MTKDEGLPFRRSGCPLGVVFRPSSIRHHSPDGVLLRRSLLLDGRAGHVAIRAEHAAVPGSGRMVAPQASQWATTTQASSGIVRVDAAPQVGQVSVDSNWFVINRSL